MSEQRTIVTKPTDEAALAEGPYTYRASLSLFPHNNANPTNEADLTPNPEHQERNTPKSLLPMLHRKSCPPQAFNGKGRGSFLLYNTPMATND